MTASPAIDNATLVLIISECFIAIVGMMIL